MTFEEFMHLMEEEMHETGLFRSHTAAEWDVLWKKAKRNIELWGQDGEKLPVGAEVKVLVSGHGVVVGDYKRFDGVDQHDNRFFALRRLNLTNETRLGTSLVDRRYWWAEIFKDE